MHYCLSYFFFVFMILACKFMSMIHLQLIFEYGVRYPVVIWIFRNFWKDFLYQMVLTALSKGKWPYKCGFISGLCRQSLCHCHAILITITLLQSLSQDNVNCTMFSFFIKIVLDIKIFIFSYKYYNHFRNTVSLQVIWRRTDILTILSISVQEKGGFCVYTGLLNLSQQYIEVFSVMLL